MGKRLKSKTASRGMPIAAPYGSLGALGAPHQGVADTRTSRYHRIDNSLGKEFSQSQIQSLVSTQAENYSQPLELQYPQPLHICHVCHKSCAYITGSSISFDVARVMVRLPLTVALIQSFVFGHSAHISTAILGRNLTYVNIVERGFH